MTQTAWFSNTLVRKWLMALSGLFLVLFLVGHLAGNLQLLLSNEADAARLQFNAYAHFMTTNPVIKLLSYVTYAAILLHVLYALLLTLANRKARAGGYASGTQRKGTTWASRNMGVLGTLVLLFLVIHLRNFWYKMHWGAIGIDAAEHKDLYNVVIQSFQSEVYVVLYVLSMGVLSYHLWHGFQSACRTLGLHHPNYTRLIQWIGRAFAIVVPLLFAIIPIMVYCSH